VIVNEKECSYVVYCWKFTGSGKRGNENEKFFNKYEKNAA